MKLLYKRYNLWTQQKAVSTVVCLIAGLLLPYIYACGIEFIRAGSVYYTLQYFAAHWVKLMLGSAAVSLIFWFISILCGRPWVANLIVGLSLIVMGAANKYKLMWRGDPLLPKDLVQISAAAGVAQNLRIVPEREMILLLLFCIVVCVLL